MSGTPGSSCVSTGADGVVRGSSVPAGIEAGLLSIDGANCTRRAGRCYMDPTACLVG